MLFLLALLAFSGPPQPASLLREGLIALEHGQLSEARKDLEQARAADPKNAYISSSLAEVYLRMREPKLARQAAETAERQGGGTDPILAHALAMFYSEAGDSAHAAKLEATYAQSSRADRNALSRVASFYLEAGDAAAAVTFARQASERQPSAANQDLLGRALEAEGKPAEAAPYLEAAWQADKTDSRIAFDWAQLLFRKPDFQAGAAVLEPALRAHPRDPQLVLAMGVARYGERRFDDAIAAFLDVIGIDQTIPQPYLFLGKMLEQAGPKLAEITADDEKWATANPNNAKAQYSLAVALMTADPTSARAASLLQKSIALDPHDWQPYYQWGVVLEREHKYAEAETEFHHAIQLDPNQPMPHYHLARVYDRLGKSDQAAAEREIHRKLMAPAGGGMQ
ncbi:MAG TPA: tetratricopeptide repeat protein [Bryobacteraceae bacterium]|nr:tetratricopeptide repeat protein [Bryobacteraceae bacterium]